MAGEPCVFLSDAGDVMLRDRAGREQKIIFRLDDPTALDRLDSDTRISTDALVLAMPWAPKPRVEIFQALGKTRTHVAWTPDQVRVLLTLARACTETAVQYIQERVRPDAEG